ncbi:hypothetical protein [Inquilinus sp. CA228]|uniref:hypothetical protein n=1 Tax=Inquilinus sp. CA228 TaxID=3455609 RepID=UPI003F8D8B51
MTLLVWPPGLPQKPLAKGYVEQPPMTDRETSVDLGVSMLGVQSTVGVGSLGLSYALRAAHTQMFDQFYQVDAKGKVWQLPHPRLHGAPLLNADGSLITLEDGTPILLSKFLTVRFKPKVSPRYQPMGNGVWWEVALQLEWLPS